jgi:O-antigen/teichoic acid export membrane protein|tara:strand:+ start:605 stop:2101 length:1497 start_codon:yes stop_codon:yes gene_type:complete
LLKYVKETIKNSAIYSLGNVFVKLTGFILIPFLTNPEYLSVNDYGALGVFEAVNQIVISIMGFGLYNSLIRWYYEQDKDENRATFFTSSLLIGFLVIAIVSITYLFKSDLSLLIFENADYQDIVVLVMVSTGLQALGVMPATLMRMQERAGFFTVTNIIKLLVTLIVTLYFLLMRSDGLFAIYAGQIAGFTIYLIILIPYMLKNSMLRIHYPVFTEMMGYGVSMMMAGLAASSTNVIDRFVLNSMSGLQEVGLYSLAYKVSSILKVLIITSVSMALTPLMFKKLKDPDSHRFYQKTMTYYGFGMMICIMGVSLFGKEVLKVFTGSAVYWSSFSVIPILAFGLFFVALNDVVNIGLRIAKKTSRITLMTAIVSILNLVLNILMIPVLGAEGAALASFISHLVFFLGLFYFSNKVYPIQFEWRKIILIFSIGVALVYASLLTNGMHLAIRLTVKTSAILMFPFILYLFNFYEEVELKQIKKIWLQWKNPKNWKENIKQLK